MKRFQPQFPLCDEEIIRNQLRGVEHAWPVDKVKQREAKAVKATKAQLEWQRRALIR